MAKPQRESEPQNTREVKAETYHLEALAVGAVAARGVHSETAVTAEAVLA